MKKSENKKEILNIEYNNACMVIKAINEKGNFKEAAKLLGLNETTVYEIVRRNHIKVYKRTEGRRYINEKEQIVYRDDKGNIIKEFPFMNTL